jgi:hypothetical protein
MNILKTAVTLSLFIFNMKFCQAELIFENTRVKFSPPKIAVGYMDIRNTGPQAVTLTLKSIDGFQASEIHESYKLSGQSGMRRLNILEIPSAESISLAPGGKHIMLYSPDKNIHKQHTIKARLLLDGQLKVVELKVKPVF